MSDFERYVIFALGAMSGWLVCWVRATPRYRPRESVPQGRRRRRTALDRLEATVRESEDKQDN